MQTSNIALFLFLISSLTACSLDDLTSQDNNRPGENDQDMRVISSGRDMSMSERDMAEVDMRMDIDMRTTRRDMFVGEDMQPSQDMSMLPDMLCPAPSCDRQCGVVVSPCGTTADCGECPDDKLLEERASWVDDYVRTLINETYVSDLTPSFDLTTLQKETRDILRQYKASDAGVIAALRNAMLRTQIGHLSISGKGRLACGEIEGAGDVNVSKYGVCAVTHKEGFIVTASLPNNPMNLQPGDIITSVQGRSGKAMIDYSLSLPVCDVGAASPQARAENAARSLFSALPDGATLTTRDPEGSVRNIMVPEPSRDIMTWLSCHDALGRSGQYVAKSSLRPDGVGVIHLPRFVPLGGFDPNKDIQRQSDQLEDDILVEFNKVKNARALIWDIRSNPGGASRVGFSIVEGMPGAKSVGLARCTTRIPNTTPPQYQFFGPNYDLVPQNKFGFDGPVAVLIDGRTFSAGDYFALAASLGSDATLVGSQAAGAYGGNGPRKRIQGPLEFMASYDPFRCNDLMGTPLETRGVEPDAHVDYDPTDLAQGIDTVEEEAAMMLLTF